MFYDYSTFTKMAALLIKAWEGGTRFVRVVLVAGFVCALAAIAIVAYMENSGPTVEVYRILGYAAATLGSLAALNLVGILAYQQVRDSQARQEEVQLVEEQVRENPEKPQLAWDLARTKLENYLDRNLDQLRSIYWLTLIVMMSGFGFIMYGLFQASENPQKLPVSVIASASGVLISFIGGSFLVIYRSVLAQSKEYVTVLERINAVGMAVQVIANIPDDHGPLKHSTTADLAKQLLSMYAIGAVENKKISLRRPVPK